MLTKQPELVFFLFLFFSFPRQKPCWMNQIGDFFFNIDKSFSGLLLKNTGHDSSAFWAYGNSDNVLLTFSETCFSVVFLEEVD